jgi:hypothetical protein
VGIIVMRSISEKNEAVERPRGVVLIAWVFFALAALMIVYGVLLAASVIAFTRAAWVIGIEAAQLGPGVFAVGAAVYVACGMGMLRVWKWARWLAILLLVAGLAQQVPTVSAAVAEFHFVSLLREGVLFIGRVVCLRYLFQADVRELFESR